MEKNVAKHESMGMLSISNRQGHARKYFGSGIKHTDIITLELHEASVERNLNTDWYRPEKLIASVDITPNEFTRMLTRPNTSGVPVTFSYKEGKRISSSDYYDINPLEQVNEEFKKRVDATAKQVGELDKAIESILETTTLSKKKKEEILGEINRVKREIGSNLPYILKLQQEAAEKMTYDAQNAFEHTVNNRIHDLGLESLQEKKQRLLLGLPLTDEE